MRMSEEDNNSDKNEENDDFQVPAGYLHPTEANDSRSTARFVIVIPTEPC